MHATTTFKAQKGSKDIVMCAKKTKIMTLFNWHYYVSYNDFIQLTDIRSDIEPGWAVPCLQAEEDAYCT